jgi:hypothetical protein
MLHQQFIGTNVEKILLSKIHGTKIPDIRRIYIKGYLYPISYPKIAQKDPFFEWDMLKDIYVSVISDF